MKVLTAVVNNPTFIEIQYNTLKKYMKCPYEFIVFNDAKPFPDFTNEGDVTLRTQISDLCSRLNIKCVNIENEHHREKTNASSRTADSCNHMLDYQIHNPDKYLVLDSDMFLVDDFYGNEYDNYKCAVVLQSRDDHTTHYFWNGLYYFDMNKIKDTYLMNWKCDVGTDTGWMMQLWLGYQTEDFPNTDEIRHSNKSFHRDDIYYIKHLWSTSWDESEYPENLKKNRELLAFMKEDPRNNAQGKYFCEIYDNKFLHYRAGGNWNNEGMNLHLHLANKLKDILQ